MKNTLYYGDNLQILQDHIASESEDLIYLDPPFKSNQTYNVLFREKNGSESAAQIRAFEDTWHWDQRAAAAYQDIVESGPEAVSRFMQGMREFIGTNDMLAYLSMMAPRLVELRRVLKPTGSIYLHCDPTASHFLKLLMDTVFGGRNFRNEIIWKRADPKGHAYTRFPSTHDVLLFYTRGEKATWNAQYLPYDEEYIQTFYRNVEPETGRRYTLSDVTNPNKDRPHLTYEWKGVMRVWRWTKERMQEMDRQGRLVYSRTGLPRYKRYLDEMPGAPATDIWTDIKFVTSHSKERLGYPTQKPEVLLERIITASSNEGDVVLDPFCGCGTTVTVAHRLKRRWIGIDITHLAVALMRHRLRSAFGEEVEKIYEVVGEPKDVASARVLAEQDRFQFEWWALGLVGARPTEGKRGSDKGIDGRLYFHDEPEKKKAKTKQVILQVKSGHTGPAHVRDLRGVVEREKAEIGVLVTLEEPTKQMRTEAASAGFYQSPGWNKSYPRLQILTIAQLLAGKRINYPGTNVTLKNAPRVKGKEQDESKLPGV